MMYEVVWKKGNTFPLYGQAKWALIKNRIMVNDLDEMEVKRQTRSWLPTNPMLVGEPYANKFVPPSAINILKGDMIAISRRNSLNLTIAFSATAAILLIMTAFTKVNSIIPFSFSCLLLAMGFYLDYLYSKYSFNLNEKAQFYYWLKTSKEAIKIFRLWVIFIGIMGVSQLILVYHYGSVHQLIKVLGVYYPAVRSGQMWRLFIGPYFHYSLLLFMINALILIFAGWLCSMLNNTFVIFMFVIGNVVGAYAQMSLGGQLFNNYTGVSPGIFSLIATFVSYGFLNKGSLPKGVGANFALIFLAAMVSTAYLPHTATVSHIAGSLVGLIGGVFYSLFFWSKKNSL